MMWTKTLCAGVILICLAACQSSAVRNPVVGAWVVKMPDAPFPMHMFVFHADGTVQQSNPDAGDPRASDSNLMGAWRADGAEVRGKLVEVTADRTSHQFAGRIEIAFALTVKGDTLEGQANAEFFDAEGKRAGTPVRVAMTGDRVLP